MQENVSFTKCITGDWSTYPTIKGQYLIKYRDDCDTPFYMISYFRPKDELDILGKLKNKGFYFDENCEAEANIEEKWGYKPFEYCFLRNLLQENGLYE